MGSINIKSEREFLREILEKIDSGKYAIPVFQRDYVWKKQQVLDLFDSVSKGYPIGSIILWEPMGNISNSKDILTDEKKNAPQPAYYILDGRQRLTTFYGCLSPNVKKKDIFKLYYDLENDSFLYAKKATETILSLSDIYDTFTMLRCMQVIMGMDLAEPKKEEYINRARRLNSLLQSYVIGEIRMDSCSLEEASVAFARVNSKGTEMSKVSMLQALTYKRTDSMLVAEVIDDILASLAPYGFDNLKAEYILNCFYQYVGKKSYDTKLEELADMDFTPYLTQIKADIVKTVKFLYEDCRVISSKLLPYVKQLELVCGFFRRKESPSQEELFELKRWFFYTTYMQSFMNSSLSIVRKIYRRFDLFLDGTEKCAMDYEGILLDDKLEPYFRLTSAKNDFLVLVEIDHYLKKHHVEEPIYWGTQRIGKDKSPVSAVVKVAPEDKWILANLPTQENEDVLERYCLTKDMIALLKAKAYGEFSHEREQYLLSLQQRFLQDLNIECRYKL